MRARSLLRITKVVHTVAWAGFVACIGSIFVFTRWGEIPRAAIAIGIVFFEVLALAANRGRCPLTSVAARYTRDRPDNFDIFLPVWLARHNKTIFGGLYVAGILYTIAQANR